MNSRKNRPPAVPAPREEPAEAEQEVQASNADDSGEDNSSNGNIVEEVQASLTEFRDSMRKEMKDFISEAIRENLFTNAASVGARLPTRRDTRPRQGVRQIARLLRSFRDDESDVDLSGEEDDEPRCVGINGKTYRLEDALISLSSLPAKSFGHRWKPFVGFISEIATAIRDWHDQDADPTECATRATQALNNLATLFQVLHEKPTESKNDQYLHAVAGLLSAERMRLPLASKLAVVYKTASGMVPPRPKEKPPKMDPATRPKVPTKDCPRCHKGRHWADECPNGQTNAKPAPLNTAPAVSQLQ